jgi:hypothetical protein
VTLLCPDREPLVLAETGGDGRFAAALDGDVWNGCWVVAEKAGFYSEKVRVMDACAYGRRDRCASVVLDARLGPRPTP